MEEKYHPSSTISMRLNIRVKYLFGDILVIMRQKYVHETRHAIAKSGYLLIL
jgi:hypothetical protein